MSSPCQIRVRPWQSSLITNCLIEYTFLLYLVLDYRNQYIHYFETSIRLAFDLKKNLYKIPRGNAWRNFVGRTGRVSVNMSASANALYLKILHSFDFLSFFTLNQPINDRFHHLFSKFLNSSLSILTKRLKHYYYTNSFYNYAIHLFHFSFFLFPFLCSIPRLSWPSHLSSRQRRIRRQRKRRFFRRPSHRYRRRCCRLFRLQR